MQKRETYVRSTVLVLLTFLFAARPSVAQEPTADDVRALSAKFGEERAKVVKEGIGKRFVPALLEKADELAKKAEAALAEGRLRQASEAFRLARWQLPYQPDKMPEHVARIIGNLRLRHNQPIGAVAFSPDGTRLITGSRDETVKVWDLANGHELRAFTGHQNALRFVAFRPDGRHVASADIKNDVLIWDPVTGKTVLNLKVPEEQTTALAYSRDGKHLLVATVGAVGMVAHHVLTTYDAQTGAVKRTDSDFRAKVSSLAFTDDGTRLAVGSEDGQVRLWQYPELIDNPKLPAYWTKQHDSGAIYAVCFSPDGKTLVCSGADSVKLYQTVQPGAGLQLSTPRLTLADSAFAPVLLFSPDGKTLFTGGNDGLVRFFDPENGQPIGSFKGQGGAIRSLAFNPKGNQLASASLEYVVRLWDFEVVLQARDFAAHDGPVWAAGFSPDAKRLVSAGADKSVKVWDLASGKVERVLAGHTAPVTAALFSPDGKFIASAGGDKTLRLWHADTGAPLRTCDGHAATITALDISADSQRVVTGSADRRIKVWNALTGKETLSIEDNPSLVAAVAFRPDGKEIAVGNVDRTICLYDAATGKLRHKWLAHGISVSCLAYSPDGLALASGGSDQLVRIWSVNQPADPPIIITGHAGPVSSVAFRKDNQHLVSAGADQLIKLWKLDASGPKELQTFRGHKDWVSSVAFSNDGFYIVSASVDRHLKIWEITSREIPLQAEHTRSVDTLALSPDGTLIVSGSSDHTIKVWELATGLERRTLHGHTQPVLAVAFAPGGKTLASSGADNVIQLWDLEAGKMLPRVGNQTLHFNNLSRGSPYLFITPDAKRLLAWFPIEQANVTTLVHCHDLETGNQLYTFSENNRRVNSLSFCANGKLVATGASNGSVRLWKLEDRQAQMLPGGDWMIFDNKTGVADIALTPDGETLIATSDKGEVKIASVATRQVHKTFEGHKDSRIMACVVSPDGKRFATAGLDNIVKAWDAETGKELRQWVLAPPAQTQVNLLVQALAFTPDGRHLVTANRNTTLYVLEVP